jgi:hypothetical protein
MSADQPNERTEKLRPTRAQRIVAAGFLAAFALTIITVLLTGLWVRAPHSRGATPAAGAAEPQRTAPADSRRVEPAELR